MPNKPNGLGQVTASVNVSNSQVHEPGLKRLKIALACEECRNRKVRCDGAEPICGACRRRRKSHPPNCVYPDKWPSGVSARYIEQLETRIQQLEASQNGHKATSTGDAHNFEGLLPMFSPQDVVPTPINPTIVGGATGVNDSSIGNVASPVPQAPEDQQDDEDDLDSISPLERGEGVDGMGNIGITENSYSEESSSTASFMKQVKAATAARLSSCSRRVPTTAFLHETPPPWMDPRLSQHGQSVAELFVLPPRRIADQMMDVYWKEVHILYPLLVRNRFEVAYQRVWSGEDHEGGQKLIYCTLNLIFAITCQVTKREAPKEKAAAGDIFYRRASQLLQFNVIGGASLELIQSLLLMGQYLQSTEWPHRCWVVVGLAIRIGQGLGLYLPRTTKGLPQQDRELALRLWHGCVFMDRMVAMTLGRPTMVPKADALTVPLPAAIDDPYLSTKAGQDGSQPVGEMSVVEFYVQSLKLYIINEETLTALYKSDGSDAPTSAMNKLASLDLNTILRIDMTITSWYDSLPEQLKARKHPSDDFTEPIFARQSNTLRLRCLQVQILLFRPVLVLLLAPEIRARATSSPHAGAGIALEMGLVCVRKCILSALEVINIIYQRQLTQPSSLIEPLPAWWYEVFFIYTAATALIPTRVYSYIRGEVPLDLLTEAWKQALEVLRRLAPISSSATRCLAALELLNDELVSEESNGSVNISQGEPASSLDAISATTMQDSNAQAQGQAPSSMLTTTTSQPIFSGINEQQYYPQQYEMQVGDAFGTIPELQDFTWLESLPADLLAGGYEDLPQLYQAL